MDHLFLEVLIWIFKALFSKKERPPSAPAVSRVPVKPSTEAHQQGTQGASYLEQKTAEVWDAYRRKQEALEKELRSKSPRR